MAFKQLKSMAGTIYLPTQTTGLKSKGRGLKMDYGRMSRTKGLWGEGRVTWRDDSNAVIHKAIAEIGTETPDIDELFKRISKEYYPFGERAMWPYKAWLDAIQKCKAEYRYRMSPKPQEPINYNTGMFKEAE